MSLYRGNLNGINALLFGNFLGITDAPGAHLAAGGGRARSASSPSISRPLLFASIDPDVAPARGVPVRRLSLLFLRPAGLGGRRGQPDHRRAARVRPARHARRHRAAAHAPARCSGEPSPSPSGWPSRGSGSAIAYFSPYPIGFWVTTLAFGVYVAAGAGTRRRVRRAESSGRRREPASGLRPAGVVLGRRWPAGPAVPAQRLPGRNRHRGGLRARRLLPRAAQPGLHRRRAQPRGLHRRPGGVGLRGRPPPRALRRRPSPWGS